jgi:putative ABC transport system permease protein
MTPSSLLPTLLGVVLLVAATTGVLWLAGAPYRWDPAWAVLRAAIQLAAISVVLGGVIGSPVWVGVALLVMFLVATITAARRVGLLPRAWAKVGFACAAGAATALGIVFTAGAVALEPRYVLALGGITVGGTMTSATLAGRRFNEAVRERWDEVEGWLALGAPPRVATREMARAAVHAALVPATDQTRTTGLVTLPGAFVGAIFGGLSPVEAGRFQVVVLAALLAAGSVTATLLVGLLGPLHARP